MFQSPKKSAENYPALDYDKILIAFDMLQLKKDRSYKI